jgi:hypothetical protein
MDEEHDTFQIFLNSRDATTFNNGSSDCDFYFKNIECLSQFHIHLSVKHAVIPYSFFNINTNNNQLFIRLYNTQGFTQNLSFSLSLGNHTIASILTELKLLLGTSFTITYNSITNKLSFTHSTYEFVLLSSSSCLEIIGFAIGKDITTINKSVESNTSVNLQSVQCICINTNIHTNSINTGNLNNAHSLASIPLNQTPFSMITYVNNSNFRVNTYSNNLNQITIKLLDQSSNVINLNGLHWTMTLQVDILKYTDD